jgi:hypothetical protein
VALHQLTSFALGVPNPAETAAYYREFGLTDEGEGWLATRDGGRQLRLVAAPTRRLLELRIGVDDADDLARWGPPPPPSFLHPDDLADLMAGSHSRSLF